MRKWYFAAVAFLVISCGKNGPLEKPWPAFVAGHQNFSDSDWEQVVNALNYLNRGTSQTLVSLEPLADGFPIHFKKVPAPQENRKRAGLAIVSSVECVVELSDNIFQSLFRDYVIPVVDHEIGHCAGLDHTDTTGDIMSPSTRRLSEYSADSLQFFFSSVKIKLGF